MKKALLAMILGLMLLGLPQAASAEMFQGFVFLENGELYLDELDGGIFLLDGQGIEQFLDKEVIVEGELVEHESGVLIIQVNGIREIETTLDGAGDTALLETAH